MKKKELLSPVGNMECLYQAVQNGCDAVYLSGKDFGARKYATNFSIEEIEEAIKYCHLFDVKVYITVNILIHDEEINDALSFIEQIHNFGVDAVIMQDVGLINLVNKTFPNLEIHASTQLHNHNKDNLLFLKDLGVKRAVLARELSVLEIKELDNTLDLEIFIHGALCTSYSGQCLFSSLVLKRSGNRGECAGLCRLKYKLQLNDKEISNNMFLLSPKELNTSKDLYEILNLDNVTSLKIEGRMKSPEYVGFITSLYRKIIDKYYLNEKYVISAEEQKELAILFNRGFTKGHLFNQTDDNLMNIKTSNHQGIEIGEVIEVNAKRIKIKLSDDLYQEDGIRFSNEEGMFCNFIYNEKDLLISGASKGDIIEVDNKANLEELGKVLKTSSIMLNKKLSLLPKREVFIKGEFIAKENEPMKFVITDDNFIVEKIGTICEKAINQPTTKERIKEQLEKTNDTVFKFSSILVDSDDLFIPIKLINELRREALLELKTLRENRKKIVEKNEVTFSEKNTDNQIEINVSVVNEEQLLEVVKSEVDNIYVSDLNLYDKYKDQFNIYLMTPRVISDYDKYKNIDRVLINELGGINYFKNKDNIRLNYYNNVYNAYTVKFYVDRNIKNISLSIELGLSDIRNLCISYKNKFNNNIPVELTIYGYPEIMIMKYCPVKMLNKTCRDCPKTGYSVTDRNNEKYELITNCNETSILNYRPVDRFLEVDALIEIGIKSFRLDFRNESISEINKLICSLKNKLNK